MASKGFHRILTDYGLITVSALLTAVAVNMFFIPARLAPGGITGLSIICSLLTGLSVSVMTLCIAIPLLILATLLLGKSFGMKTLYITLATPVCMKVIPRVNLNDVPGFLPDFLAVLICAVGGGILVGLAIGIALNQDCATGGTDVIALLIRHFLKFLKLPVILLLLDGAVIVASGFISHDIFVAAFSLLSLFIIINTIKFVTARKTIHPE